MAEVFSLQEKKTLDLQRQSNSAREWRGSDEEKKKKTRRKKKKIFCLKFLDVTAAAERSKRAPEEH